MRLTPNIIALTFYKRSAVIIRSNGGYFRFPLKIM